ncbi:uncharacterized protein topaz1 [Vanacampus margaritifer]
MEPSTDPQKADAMASCTRSSWVNSGRRTDEQPGAFQGTSLVLVPMRRRCLTGFRRDVNPKPTSFAGSGGSLRRVIRSSGCGLCGDCKLISPVKKVLVKQKRNSPTSRPEDRKATRALQEDLDPKVDLCDVVLNSDASCHDFGFVLPDGLDTKNVHCFKRDVRLRPRCSGPHKHGMSRPKLQSDDVSQPGRRQQMESADRDVLTNRPSFKGWADDVSPTWPASTTTGKQSVEPRPRRARDTVATEIDAGKINNQPNCFSNEEERCRTSNGPRPDLTFGTSDGPQACTVSEETAELCDDDDPRSFTCQRTRVYVPKTKHSCARTCITWHDKRLILNGVIHLERSKNVSPQTATVPSVPTPRRPSPSFDKCQEANGVQSQSGQTTNRHRSPDVARSCSFPGSLDDDDDDDEALNGESRPSSVSEPGSGSPERADGEGRPSERGAGGDAHSRVLDEFTAYQHDILLVDVNLDDSDLFGELPRESLLKLGPDRPHQDPKTLTTYGAPQTVKQSWTPVNINLQCGSPDNDEIPSRPWRPKKASPKAKRVVFNQENHSKPMDASFASRNHVIRGLQERVEHTEAVNEAHNPDPRLGSVRKGALLPTPAHKTGPRCQTFDSIQYCRKFFSESQSCNYKMCRFLHAPANGDEKFCVDTVARFTQNPTYLQKAATLFISYYQNNPPGMFFSTPVFLSLLWALLRAGVTHDVLSVLSVSLAHKIMPNHEFLLALFTFVREKGCTSVVPQLMQLAYKMASEHFVLSVDCFDVVKNNPEFQKLIHPNLSDKQRLSVSAGDSLNLAHVIVEMELCATQEEWRHLGEAFRSICTPCHHPSQLERISGRIAIALLSKDKLSVPFAAFAETICHNEDPDSLLMCFIGRIGVSLMLRYHRTQQWAKGRRVVEVLSQTKINYSTQKGLFGNEDGRSRCHRITLAAELFVLCGSLEGAVKTLRENEWFVSSSKWPCQPPDLESRSRMLTHLAENASHRDTLEVLSNLPGIQEPNDQVDISKYTHLFNTHLQVCVDKLILPVAADSVDFMLSRKLPVDGAVLQALLHKLGKQNHWPLARKVFRHSLTAGYYPAVSAPTGFTALIVPSRLGEVELALTFEILITANAPLVLPLSETTPSALSITLKRSQESESEYLSAGSRLLAAARVPQPELEVRYDAVNSSREQVFMLSVASARRWLHSNQTWANEVWIY